MTVRDLIPWGRDNSRIGKSLRDELRDPFLSLHREINRLFTDSFRSFDNHLPFSGAAPFSAGGWPNVEISDNEKQIKVTAEMPGMEEKDVEVLLDDGVLTLRGEKRSEIEDKDKQFSERTYGRFERRIPLGRDIEEDKVEARFESGVLTITLPRTAQSQSQVKRIAIKS